MTTRSTRNRIAKAAALVLLAAILLMGKAPTASASSLGVHLDADGLLIISGTSINDGIRIADNSAGLVMIDHRTSGADDWQRVTSRTGVKNIDVETLGGNDYVEVRLGYLEGRVTADLGAGNDHFRLSYALQGAFNTGIGSLVLKTGSGIDGASFLRSYVRGSARVAAGDGNFSVSTHISDWGGPAKFVKTGSGRFTLHGNGNDNYAGDLTVIGGNDIEELHIGADTFVHGAALFDMNGGDDEVDVVQAEFRANLTFKGDGGNDRLIVLRSELQKRLVFRGSGGDDMLSVQRSSLGARVAFVGGGGDDLVNLGVSTFGAAVSLNGGADYDRAVGEANTFNGPPPVMRNFEAG